ncbi:MAG: UDP-N-acetylglucosamine 2-epimerase (hydrolyzing) [Sediminibacterium magnilacihabitans]|nr:UDP-N-acetylglucosamine 2-epimerase (hydrolyzing) [Sediminibacterium magnilacihabitans]PQV60065.1 GDP/UDP-N,N'-diacetylbacillosamine 2-epimerase (hydrolysing) [Sediminibacterium magnilacihabitans]
MSIRIGVLTSSRADFGIYMPLLHLMNNDSDFSVELIVFGTHLSYLHGYTINDIKREGFTIFQQIESLIVGDSEESIADSTGLTTLKFSSFWALHRQRYDYVCCLGDRYEMFAAVAAGIPFHIRFVHFHGGEKTLGAIDNIYRHSISHAATVHFTSTEQYAERLRLMLDNNSYVFNVGALSLDNISQLRLYDREAFRSVWNIDTLKPTVLVTFHPETGADEGNNEAYAKLLTEVINGMPQYQFVITMPNADSDGNRIRTIFNEQLEGAHIRLIENFGTKGYFSCMQLASAVLGNSSSGIIEAASFGRYNINLGKRQEGRMRSENNVDLPFDKQAIIHQINKVMADPVYKGRNIYWNGGASENAVNILKNIARG